MGDYGAAVSQKGYPVQTCADRFLAYSSAFKNLKVFNRYTVSAAIPGTITINHNLGYYAPFLVIFNGGTGIFAGESRMMSDYSYYSIHDKVTNSVNTLTIDVTTDFGGAGNTAEFLVYIFLEDFTTFNEQNINTGTSSGASSTDYGMRISKDGYDVKTCTDDQLVFSSSFFNSICHKIGIDTSGGLMTISHNLGYAPAALCYIRDSGGSVIKMCEGMPYYLNPFFGGREGYFYKADASNIYIGENYLDPVEFDAAWRTGNSAYYIIFKDAKLT